MKRKKQYTVKNKEVTTPIIMCPKKDNNERVMCCDRTRFGHICDIKATKSQPKSI